jgi:two-component system KDP operon response regulator KdpE
MTTNAVIPFQLHSQTPAAGQEASPVALAAVRNLATERGDPNCVAVIVYTRIYPASSVLQGLVSLGFLTAERPGRDNTAQVVDDLKPSLVVLAVDPRREQDVRLARDILAETSAGALALLPAFEPKLAALLLDAGADVCLHDSETPELLNAQLGALARWCRPAGPERPETRASIVVGDFTVDLDRRQLFRNGTRIGLTPVEFRILEILASNAGKVCGIPELFRDVRGCDSSIGEAREWAKVYIRRIRRKIEDDPARPGHIVNVRGFGYLLEPGSVGAEWPLRAA